MTYGAIYKLSTSRTYQYRSGVVAAVQKPCNCRQGDGRGLRDVHTTSLSLFARGANPAAAAADSPAQGCVHRKITPCYCRRSASASAPTRSVSQPVSRASATKLSASRRFQWLNTGPQVVKSNWNTLSIDYWRSNWHRSTTRWYRIRSGTKTNLPLNR